jgi:eukaryotic translation initiation factor 2-alpha kinase 4
MPPTNPWGKKQQQQRNTSSSGFPELKPTKSNETAAKAAPKSQYEEIQEEELFALAAIYAEDFKRVGKNHGAWKVR